MLKGEDLKVDFREIAPTARQINYGRERERRIYEKLFDDLQQLYKKRRNEAYLVPHLSPMWGWLLLLKWMEKDIASSFFLFFWLYSRQENESSRVDSLRSNLGSPEENWRQENESEHVIDRCMRE